MSKPYIDMTLQVLEKFGIRIENDNYRKFTIPGKQKYKPCSFEVESDWSGGAFLLVAGAINGDITIHGLHPDSKQSDKAILMALDKAGAQISITDNSVSIRKSELKSFEFDATEAPDLFPPLAVLAAYSKGISGIKGVNRLIYKESDRAAAIVEEFAKMNIKVEVTGDYMLITGGTIKGAHVTSHDDHRIAMAEAIAGLGATDKVFIKDSQCVGKSYPGFFNDLRKMGASVYE
jgi:3-phosphoshikimate 1-carboxyvinyltransferase